MNIDELQDSKALFLTLDEVCGTILPCSGKTMRRQLKTNGVSYPFVKFGDRYYVSKQWLLRYLENDLPVERMR